MIFIVPRSWVTVLSVAACLKDLQRLLRQDTETREAFQVLGQYNIAKSDLVPIIVTYPKDTDLVYNACKGSLVLHSQYAQQPSLLMTPQHAVQ